MFVQATISFGQYGRRRVRQASEFLPPELQDRDGVALDRVQRGYPTAAMSETL